MATVTSVGKSLENREMYVLYLSTGGGGTKPAVYIDSTIHAREWITLASIIYVINKLVRGYGTTDTEAHQLLTDYDWLVMVKEQILH